MNQVFLSTNLDFINLKLNLNLTYSKFTNFQMFCQNFQIIFWKLILSNKK